MAMLVQPPQVGSFRFSTAGVPAHERHNAIHQLRERGILPIEPLPDHAVSVQVNKCFLPGAGILSGTLCGVRQDGNLQAIGDDLFFGVNIAGRSTAFQRGDEIVIGDGDATVKSCAAGALAPLVTGLDDRMMRLVPRDTPALQLLTSYVSAVVHVRNQASPEVSHAVVTHLHDLIALSVGATRDATAMAGRSVRAARLQAIKCDIAANLANGSLTAAAIAARHRLTPPYLHKLFKGEGITFTQFIQGERLDRAYRMLRDPRFVIRGAHHHIDRI
jgi:AraC-like DNA-binding protein